ncbi:MAG: hypothetical protein F6K31_06730 [Symploca sp. SIO2G7]|nr:hypothetical protein [Symploca sp. SIO2G7]
MKNAQAYQVLKSQITALIDEWDPSGGALLEIAADVADNYPALSHISGLLVATHEQMVRLEYQNELLRQNDIPIE